MIEEWRDVVGFEGLYQISNLANLRSLTRTIEYTNRWGTRTEYVIYAQILVPRPVQGYMTVKLNNYGKTMKKLHRMVAEAFLPNPENLSEVNHIDGNKLNNRLDNLEWVNRRDNTNHAYQNGLAHSGSSSHYAKLNERTVAEILFINATTDLTYPKIAELFNICAESVSNMCRGKSWKRPHVKAEIANWNMKLQSGEETLSVDLTSVTVSGKSFRKRVTQ